MNTTKNFNRSILTLLLFGVTPFPQAGTVGTLNTFTTGTTLSASQVNSNYSTVQLAFTNKTIRVTAVASSLRAVHQRGWKCQQTSGGVYRWAVISTYSQNAGGLEILGLTLFEWLPDLAGRMPTP